LERLKTAAYYVCEPIDPDQRSVKSITLNSTQPVKKTSASGFGKRRTTAAILAATTASIPSTRLPVWRVEAGGAETTIQQ
jgi:hypothetical protein